jgi:hypothetical protein
MREGSNLVQQDVRGMDVLPDGRDVQGFVALWTGINSDDLPRLDLQHSLKG